MGTRRVVQRRPAVAQPVVEVDDDEDEVVEEVVVKTAPTPVARQPRVVPPAPQPVKREPAAKRTAQPVAAKVVAEDKQPAPESNGTGPTVNHSLGTIVDEIVKRLNVGQHVGLVRLSEGSVSVFFMNEDVSKLSSPVSKRPGVGGSRFDQITQTDEYKEHQAKWAAMSLAEKQAYAKKVKATWDSTSTDERVNNMKMSVGVMAALGIQKYKPEYSTQAQRNALRDGTALPE